MFQEYGAVVDPQTLRKKGGQLRYEGEKIKESSADWRHSKAQYFSIDTLFLSHISALAIIFILRLIVLLQHTVF